jgi:hypothetical protein
MKTLQKGLSLFVIVTMILITALFSSYNFVEAQEQEDLVTVTGTVVVNSRFFYGQVRELGLMTDSLTPDIPFWDEDGKVRLWIYDDNKGRELIYWIGKQVEITGKITTGLAFQRTMQVRSYKVLSPNPIVQKRDGFRLSYLGGTLDLNGNFMGGTEVVIMEEFDGKIFAGISYWGDTLDSTNDPITSAQVIVLNKADGHWMVDHEFTDVLRVMSIKKITFTSNHLGEPLEQPVNKLVVSGSSSLLSMRREGDSNWVDTGLKAAMGGIDVAIRNFDVHTDAVTGITHLYAGAGRNYGEIWKGVYNPENDEILWEEKPEKQVLDAGPKSRVAGLVDIDGILYASIGTKFYRRIDGSNPIWEELYEDTTNPQANTPIREAASVISPDGKHKQKSILFGVEGYQSRSVRLDPFDNDKITEEFSLIEYFQPAMYAVVNYNGAITSMHKGQEVSLLGAYVLKEAGYQYGFYNWTDGVYLWRSQKGKYYSGKVIDPTLEQMPPLSGVRHFLASPFPEEEGVFYVCGYDGAQEINHNTAWIFKAHIDDILTYPIKNMWKLFIF